ncbi:MAG: ribosomal RNA small subunit methyltransferase A [Gemmatimonadetes bacterium]|nr:ribosomal RNA small subunit methyltransferase A [Gemmatimonadota bacterium]
MPIRRRFGQNFLTDQHALARIAAALELSGGEQVVEIGPGRGALTAHLVGQCRRLTCVEIDRDLVAGLRATYGAHEDVAIVEGDILATDLDALAGGPFVLVGNVPYNITTPIIFHALSSQGMQRAVFLVQREVADRLSARPGDANYGALTANVGLTCEVETVAAIPAGAFFPRPKVQSAVVRLTPRANPRVSPGRASDVRTFVTALFGQRRRQLVRALRTVSDLSAERATDVVAQAQLDATCRPETLGGAEFVRLYEAVHSA